MKKFIILLLLFFGLMPVVMAADLMEVFRQALCSDQAFKQAFSQRLADKQGVPIALSVFYPNILFTGSPSITKAIATGPGAIITPDGTTRGYIMNLSATQTIFDFGKYATVLQARALSKEADANLNVALQDLILRTARAYFAILEDEDTLVYLNATKTTFAKQLDQVTQQYKVGLKTITDVYTAKASYDNAVADYITEETQLANDKENLRVITGVYYSNIAKLSESFPLISPHPTNMECWVTTARMQNWQIRSALFAANAARQVVKQQFAGHLPTLNAQVGYNINFSRNISNPDVLLIPGSLQVVTRSAQLNLNVPIFSGGLVIAQTEQAKYNYQTAYERLDLQVRTVVNQTRQSYLNIISGISKIEADKQTVKSFISSYEGMEAGYQVGTEILVNVLNQQQKVFEAQRQYAHDRYAYVINLLLLKQATGTLCSRDLEAINSWLYQDQHGRAYSEATVRAEKDIKKAGTLG